MHNRHISVEKNSQKIEMLNYLISASLNLSSFLVTAAIKNRRQGCKTQLCDRTTQEASLAELV
jgi:hypothetical protein